MLKGDFRLSPVDGSLEQVWKPRNSYSPRSLSRRYQQPAMADKCYVLGWEPHLSFVIDIPSELLTEDHCYACVVVARLKLVNGRNRTLLTMLSKVTVLLDFVRCSSVVAVTPYAQYNDQAQ